MTKFTLDDALQAGAAGHLLMSSASALSPTENRVAQIIDRESARFGGALHRRPDGLRW